jgi:hypothetical protein
VGPEREDQVGKTERRQQDDQPADARGPAAKRNQTPNQIKLTKKSRRDDRRPRIHGRQRNRRGMVTERHHIPILGEIG